MSHKFLVLTGEMVAEQPLTTSMYNVKGKKSGSEQPLPTMSMLVGGIRGTYAYFPASGIKGGLRRSAAAVVRDLLISETNNPKPFDLPSYYLSVIGGVLGKTGADDNARNPLRDNTIRSLNPLVSLFGAGDPFIAGKIAVGHALPIMPFEPDVITGIRTNALSRNSDDVQYLTDESIEIAHKSSILTGKKSKLAGELKRLDDTGSRKIRAGEETKESLEQKKAELKEAITAIEQELVDIGSSTVSVGQVLAGYEIIPPGTQLSHQITLRNVTDAEIGLFMLMMQHFSTYPSVGGHKSSGCGQVKLRYDVKMRDMDEIKLSSMGELAVDMGVGLTFDDDYFSQCVTAFKAEFPTYNFASGAHLKQSEKPEGDA